MCDLKKKIEDYLKKEKDESFGFYFDKENKCYIYHKKFGKKRKISIDLNDDISKKFKGLIEEIYKENIKTFEDLKKAFKKYLEYYSDKDTIHIKFDKKKSFYETKINIQDKFLKTIEDNKFNKSVFEEWWDKGINSARMKGNATNLLKDEERLIKNFDIIKKASNESKNLTELFDKLNEVKGMKATARELAYFLQFNDDKFPLANDAMINTAKYIFEMLNKDLEYGFKNKGNDNKINEQKYFEFVLNKLEIDNKYFPKYYILDQFLNLIDKIKKSDLTLITKDKLQEDDKNNNVTESVYYKLYQTAYEFLNLCGKADIKSNDLKGFLGLLKINKNIIFHGIPGTGKTYTIINNIKNIINDENQMLITQFHPSFSYEDFIEGIKPVGIEKNGQLKLELKDGIFREFCNKAKNEEKEFLEKLEKENFNEALSNHGYFFIADEINRAELSRVFGELLYALEYRGENGKIKTQYAFMRDDKDFYVPENVFFLGTMNDLDKSIDSFDLALRRRFIWQEMECDYGVIRDEIYANNVEDYIKACKKLNNKISEDIGEKYQLGHSYFLKIKFKDDIEDSDMKNLFSNRFEALLKEYLRSEYSEKEIQTHLDNLKKLFIIEKIKDTKINEKNIDKNK